MNYSRLFRVGDNLSLDEGFRLHYGDRQQNILEPCREILDRNIEVGIAGNNNVNPNRLLLLERDRKPIQITIPQSEETVAVNYPGKSAFLHFAQELSGRALVRHTVTSNLERQPDRRDHIHCSNVGGILNANWHTFWAPLQSNGKVLHARLVADRTLRFNEDPTLEDANELLDVFSKLC